MKTPEKLSVVPSCPGKGSCGTCPFAELCRPKSATLRIITTSSVLGVGKQLEVRQMIPVLSGLPVPKEVAKCNKCGGRFGETCPECRKAA